jgi:hypothetical protein
MGKRKAKAPELKGQAIALSLIGYATPQPSEGDKVCSDIPSPQPIGSAVRSLRERHRQFVAMTTIR